MGRWLLCALLLAPTGSADEVPQAVAALQHLKPRSNDGPTAWTAGVYQYDGCGNITAIGNESFVYDKIGRLKAATVRGPDLITRQFLRPGVLQQSGEAVLDFMGPPSPLSVGAQAFVPGPVNSQWGKLDYLLGEVAHSDKSLGLGGFFKGELGFSKATEDLLRTELTNQFAENLAKAVRNDKGLFEITGRITGANGRIAIVRTVWEQVGDSYKLVTAVPAH
ncbi:MAG TPA: hypothetical protein VGR02_18065 [Thermoanaerobaculia bacterium]|jgi:hypothetical protein|nr:hypothetical protein [Thermoanaerobaculia bacterium]